jgi:hypothetical protein
LATPAQQFRSFVGSAGSTFTYLVPLSWLLDSAPVVLTWLSSNETAPAGTFSPFRLFLRSADASLLPSSFHYPLSVRDDQQLALGIRDGGVAMAGQKWPVVSTNVEICVGGALNMYRNLDLDGASCLTATGANYMLIGVQVLQTQAVKPLVYSAPSQNKWPGSLALSLVDPLTGEVVADPVASACAGSALTNNNNAALLCSHQLASGQSLQIHLSLTSALFLPFDSSSSTSSPYLSSLSSSWSSDTAGSTFNSALLLNLTAANIDVSADRRRCTITLTPRQTELYAVPPSLPLGASEQIQLVVPAELTAARATFFVGVLHIVHTLAPPVSPAPSSTGTAVPPATSEPVVLFVRIFLITSSSLDLNSPSFQDAFLQAVSAALALPQEWLSGQVDETATTDSGTAQGDRAPAGSVAFTLRVSFPALTTAEQSELPPNTTASADVLPRLQTQLSEPTSSLRQSSVSGALNLAAQPVLFVPPSGDSSSGDDSSNLNLDDDGSASSSGFLPGLSPAASIAVVSAAGGVLLLASVGGAWWLRGTRRRVKVTPHADANTFSSTVLTTDATVATVAIVVQPRAG